jgi:VIT1/CCC1 family predicted Fe2+/Mn2+ transporter
MPSTHHVERHFSGSAALRDVVIGMSDGLTVPFALAAGLSGAVASSHVVLTAGLAEIAAGSIAMGLGGWLAARSDREHYDAERRREAMEVEKKPELEAREVADFFASYGLTEEDAAPVIRALRKRPDAWIDFMMRFELGLERPDPSRALKSAATIAASYIAGGLVPLAPYALVAGALALPLSAGLTLIALFTFGWAKARFTGARRLTSALSTTLVGGLAAAAAFGLARLVA